MQLYKSYSFIDKDPVIDRLRTIVQDGGLKNGQVAELAGISRTTIHNWFEGDTKRPQFATVMAVSRSLGYDLQFVHASDGRVLSVTKVRFKG